MALCTSCSSDINEDSQIYQCSEMGPEIISIIQNAIGQEVDENGIICEDCFANIMQIMCAASCDTSSVQEQFELQHTHDVNVCVWCRSSLFQRRIHSLTDYARQFIAENISPRIVPEDGLVCYACWIRVRRSLPQQEVEVAPVSREPSAINMSCVWCLRSLAETRRHSLPEGPERDEIVARIFPREIPSGGRVCYACWVTARRNVQRAQNIDEVRQNPVSARHQDDSCALCRMSLFRRQTHAIPTGPARYELAASIYPRELSGHLLCTSCWTIYVRRNASQIREEASPSGTTMENVPVTTPVMELDDFTHTSNSSSHCFVPYCTNPERYNVPISLRKRILTSQKVFVTDNARVCNEHISLYNWEFLEQHEFSKVFTKTEMQSMLRLSIREVESHLDFESIEQIDDVIFKYWTGLSKQNYNIIFNQISPAMTCKKPRTALGAYLIKARTGDSHRRISSLLCVSKSAITRLLNAAREALITIFVPIHLGVNHLSREELINRNLIIPEGLFGDREERVPIVIFDGTYIYLQKSSNYLFQKKTYSLHKYRNLVKPFLLVASDGHIIDTFGPYPATESDANIMKALFQNENRELRRYFEANDVFILDRGFRDAIPFLDSLGYKVYQPESLEPGETQLSTIKANKSRCVTLCRWVVEVVNGRFKRDFKLFRNDYFNIAATHLMDDFRICASLINAFHPVIVNRPDAEIILNRAIERKEMPNRLAQLIIDNRINRFRAQFTSINAQLPELDIFPEMTLSDLTIFALGTYQIKQARSYYGEHIRQRGSFQVEVSDHLEVVSHATSSQQPDPVLVRGRIKSRHHSGRTYYSYILIARQGTSWDDKIISYYCSCISGQRTVGCCAHTMTIVWYLGWARHQDTIAAPASFLDNILIREDDDE
ncbi:uncharacterized protein LOC114350796 [Ostrinia furnacalis]|uniref:uncharacterized protein LOC114350796 n=1 Tax=Ostrinia furnacalis TaxID=93504 RepID=UPI00103E6D7E|nr:uncharacterized protein LOC114350796 [Ostrinia furnacalis]XP_028157637.1 uncharacterized protein LOC114350796 [Ostrinia furnacalis]